MLVALLLVYAAGTGAGAARGEGRGAPRNLLLRGGGELRRGHRDYGPSAGGAPRVKEQGTAVPPSTTVTRPPGVGPPGGRQAWGPLPGVRRPGAGAPAARPPGGSAPVMRAKETFDDTGLDALAEDIDIAEAIGPAAVTSATSAVRRHARRPMDAPAVGAPPAPPAPPAASPAQFHVQPVQPSPRPRRHREHAPRAHAAPPPPPAPAAERPIGREGPAPPEPAAGVTAPDAGAASSDVTTMTSGGVTDKKAKLERFVVFINKNRELLKQFIQNKRAQQGLTQAPVLRGNDVTRAPGALASAVMAGLGGATRVKKHKIARHISSSLSSSSSEDVINKDIDLDVNPQSSLHLHGSQLDLSPAKGSRIEKMRQKGRICSRHILYPEGPKYNSRGHTYMPEFVAKANRFFYMTKEPKFLLPSCCNCCAKSVLGCE